MLVALRWNVADEIVPWDCCSLGNLEQWSLWKELWRPLGRSLKGHWKVPQDGRAPLQAGRGRGRHGRKMKQWGREKREGMGAVSRNPLEGPLRTLLRESSLQLLAQKKMSWLCKCRFLRSTFKVLCVNSCRLQKKVLKILVQSQQKDDYYVLNSSFLNTSLPCHGWSSCMGRVPSAAGPLLSITPHLFDLLVLGCYQEGNE